MTVVRHYLGLDPGSSGGLVALGSDGVVSLMKMPEDLERVWRWLKLFDVENTRAVLERVQGYTGQSPTTGSGMFKFGRSFGTLEMGLVAAGIRHELCTPQKWQKSLGIEKRRKGEDKRKWKGRLKAAAQKKFPRLSITLETADALLMAEYCRRTFG